MIAVLAQRSFYMVKPQTDWSKPFIIPDFRRLSVKPSTLLAQKGTLVENIL